MRFVVGEPGRQSSVWRIWAPKNKCDIYIAIRTIIGVQKWSLHQSGDWRYQYLTDEIADEHGHGGGRIIDQWQQPDELGDSGWTHGFTIRVRHQDLVEVAEPAPVPADALWIPAPPEGQALSIDVVIARPDRGLMELKRMLPVPVFSLVDGRVVVLVCSMAPVDDVQEEMAAKAHDRILEMAAARGMDVRAMAAPRAAVSGNNSHGDRFVWDIAVTAERRRESGEPT